MMRNLPLLVVLSALAVSPASVARAANAEPFSSSPPRLSQQDLAAFAESRIAGLKAGLQLTVAQEKNWPALEAALRDIAKARAERFQALRGDGLEKPGAAVDPLARLQRRAQALTVRAGELEKVAAAARPLYDSLDDAQKRRFGPLLQTAAHERIGRHGRFSRPRDGHGGAPPL